MRALLDTSVPIGAENPGTLEGAISAVSLAELHFGALIAVDPDERARRGLRLGVIESIFEPLRSTPRSRANADAAPPPCAHAVANPADAHSTSRSPPPPTSTTYRSSPTTAPTFRSFTTSSTLTPRRSTPGTPDHAGAPAA